MEQLRSFHHYSTAVDQPRVPIEALEEEVVALLLASSVGDAERDSSICFELKHSAAVTQFARLLARKRGLPVDVCAAGALLHDIYVITSGSYADHAHQGTPIARAMLEDVGGFSAAEMEAAERIVWHHSDKQLVSTDPFAEFGKDVDVLDAFLYPGAFDWYLGNKPLSVFRHYLERAASVWGELSIGADPRFGLLDDFDAGWLDDACALRRPFERSRPTPPPRSTAAAPCLVVREGDDWIARFTRRTWARIAVKSSLAGPAEAVRSLVPPLLPSSLGQAPVLGCMLWPAVGRFEVVPDSDEGRSRLVELRGCVPITNGGR